MENDQIRAFIAAEVSDEVKAGLTRVLQRLGNTNAEVKWVRPEAVHLTLRFLGNVRSDQVEAAAAAMAEAVRGARPIPVEVKGYGMFPNERRPRVIWVGLAKGGPELSAVFERLEAALQARNFGPADKPFSPHLTLGRVRSAKGLHRAVAALAEELKESLGEYQVESLCLFQSELHPAGARYTVLKEQGFTD